MKALLFLFLTLMGSVAIAETVSVRMDTSMGVMELSLDAEKAPVTVENFLRYAKEKRYDGTIFHRVIPNFMIQGGGFEPSMQERDSEDSIKNEAANGLKNMRGTIAMARTNAPHSASNQFFINVKDNDFLNHQSPSGRGLGYCVFGKVTQGMDVMDKIQHVVTDRKSGHSDVPTTPVLINSVTVLTN